MSLDALYAQARTIYPLLPARYNVTVDASAADVSVLLDAAGVAQFTEPPGFVWTADAMDHECGHLYRRVLGRLSPATDYDALYWTFRGFPGTAAEAKTYAEGPGGPGWAGLPDESWAEAFGASVAGSWIRHEKTLDYGRAVDAMAARAFFRALAPQEAGMTLVDLPSRFRSSRNGQPVRYIVLHTTEGTDSRAWLTQTGNVSAHYLVRGPVAYRLVPEELAAWHAGRIVGTPTTPYFTGKIVGYDDAGYPVWSVNPNYESIGIEMEGYAALPLDPVTIDTTARLIEDIRTRHDVPLVDHRELSPGDRSDPGVNRALVDSALEGQEDEMTPAQEAKIDRVLAIAESLLNEANANEPLVWSSRLQRSLDVERGTPFDSALPPIDTRIRK